MTGFRKQTYRWHELARDAGRLLGRRRDVLDVWVRRAVEPAQREEWMVAVSAGNACRHCLWTHETWGLAAGASLSDVAHIVAGELDAFDAERQALLGYARQVGTTGRMDRTTPAGRAAAAAVDQQTLGRLETVALAMRIANLSANTVDAFLGRLRGRPSGHSRLADELLVLTGFAVAAPSAVLLLSALRRTPPWRLVADFRRRYPFDPSGTDETAAPPVEPSVAHRRSPEANR